MNRSFQFFLINNTTAETVGRVLATMQINNLLHWIIKPVGSSIFLEIPVDYSTYKIERRDPND